MRALFLQTSMILPAARRPPALIAIGFVVLLADAWWSALPVVTAMAAIALGATDATANRIQTAPTRYVVMAVHLFVYLSLYLLFVGAVCHAAIEGPQQGVALLRGLDLGVSVLPMAVVVRRSLAALAGRGDALVR